MLDWLRGDPRAPPVIDIAGRAVPLAIRRLANARRMTLRLAPDGSEVRISMPHWGRTADAVAFAVSRAGWLARQLATLPQRQPAVDGSAIPYRGEPVHIRHLPTAPRKVRLDDGAVHIGGPADSLEARLQRWLQGEARMLMTADLAQYCERVGKAQPRLALSNAQRRWGSCATDGSIRLNWRLVMAPDFVRRSVVAHEAAHLVHFDHSPRFHALLADIFEGEVDHANIWLKREGRSLYTPFG